MVMAVYFYGITLLPVTALFQLRLERSDEIGKKCRLVGVIKIASYKDKAVNQSVHNALSMTF